MNRIGLVLSLIVLVLGCKRPLEKKEGHMEDGIKVVKIDLTVTHMEKMKNFYGKVFSISFVETPFTIGDKKFVCFNGKASGGLHIQLVPKELTQNMVNANRQQLTFAVRAFNDACKQALANGGTEVQGVKQSVEGKPFFSVQDPDGNYLVLMGEK